MTWSWIYGCANGCTWQEKTVVCTLAVLAFAVWWAGLNWMAHKEARSSESEERNEDVTQQRR